ncbi:MAG: hypothetical protein RLZZ528_2446 [Pseudomonadota bacterium]
MSLVGTLAKVAIGIAVAKGIGGMMQGGSGGTTRTSTRGSGGILGGSRSSGGAGGLDDMMGDILSGGRSTAERSTSGRSTGQTSGGLGGLLEELSGTRSSRSTTSRSRSGGGLDDLLGELTKGSSSGGGGMGGFGDLLGSVLGGAAGGVIGGAMSGRSPTQSQSGPDIAAEGPGSITPKERDANFGEVLNQAFGKKGEPQAMPTPSQDAAAGLMLRAMIQAAKSDGKIDSAEKEKLMGNLSDATEQEIAFVKAELAAPVDVRKLVNQVPEGLEAQVYAMSVIAIDLDSQNEAQYLHALAEGLGLDRQAVNHIHEKIGVGPLYS